uniref:Uncharacterized protein n=1 Tax=Anas platyrhynchos platyrhynchos TaxID=8840 RepID=A0A493TBV3_ANAPP
MCSYFFKLYNLSCFKKNYFELSLLIRCEQLNLFVCFIVVIKSKLHLCVDVSRNQSVCIPVTF